MDANEIYQEAFEDELRKLAFITPSPSSIRKVINFSKKLKQSFEEKYDSKKKKKKRKRRFSFIFFGK